MSIHHDRFIARITAPQGVAATMALEVKSQPRESHGNVVRMVRYRGTLQALRQLCEQRGIQYRTALKRLERGWSVEASVETPIHVEVRGCIWRRA